MMDSRGVSGAIVTLQNLSTGERRSVTTNTFGYYSINEVEVGQFYMVSIAHRRYRFAESSRFFTLEDNLTDVNFVGAF
jgi:Carboxypeptidase regulatory-like domain